MAGWAGSSSRCAKAFEKIRVDLTKVWTARVSLRPEPTPTFYRETEAQGEAGMCSGHTAKLDNSPALSCAPSTSQALASTQAMEVTGARLDSGVRGPEPPRFCPGPWSPSQAEAGGSQAPLQGRDGTDAAALLWPRPECGCDRFRGEFFTGLPGEQKTSFPDTRAAACWASRTPVVCDPRKTVGVVGLPGTLLPPASRGTL